MRPDQVYAVVVSIRDVQRRIQGVAAVAEADPEEAHSQREALLVAVLQAIENGTNLDSPPELAAEALKVFDVRLRFEASA